MCYCGHDISAETSDSGLGRRLLAIFASKISHHGREWHCAIYERLDAERGRFRLGLAEDYPSYLHSLQPPVFRASFPREIQGFPSTDAPGSELPMFERQVTCMVKA